MINEESLGFAIVETDIFRHTKGCYRFFYAGYVIAGITGGFYAGKMELCLN